MSSRSFAGVADPTLKLLFAYEMAKHQMSLPANRYGWVVEPPQSLRDYSSDRALLIGRMYSAIVRLLGTGFPVEGNEGKDIDTNLSTFTVDPAVTESAEGLVKNQLVLLYMNFLGPSLVDSHIRPVLDKDGQPVTRANGEAKMQLDFDPDKLTWQMVFDMFPQIEKTKDKLMANYRQPPIGEPERDRAHFVTRAREFEHVMYREADFNDEEIDEEREQLAKRVRNKQAKITGKRTPKKRKAATATEGPSRKSRRIAAKENHGEDDGSDLSGL